MSQYVAAYDIADDQQRERVARVLLRYGYRIQKSVFIIDLEAEEIVTLQSAIGRLLARSDDFDVIPVDDGPGRPHLRWQADPDQLQPVLIVTR